MARSVTNTNMASEFWFYGQLHRLGYKAYITLANTKAIDILVELKNGRTLKFDVKGKSTWDSGSYQFLPQDTTRNHFLVFVGLRVTRLSECQVKLNGDPECLMVEKPNINEIVAHWQAIGGRQSEGFGCYPKTLRYLKSGGQEPITERTLNLFKTEHNINGDVDFTHYKKIILSMEDFENKYHRLK